jgi:polysaccharide export outer membrane protein
VLRDAGLIPYRIEPPDVVLVDVTRATPKAPYKLHQLDIIEVALKDVESEAGTSVLKAENIAILCTLGPNGKVDLGEYGSANVAGLTAEEAAKRIKTQLEDRRFSAASVSVSPLQFASLQKIEGKHLVNPDGTVQLGTYGRVKIAGLTPVESKRTVEQYLSHFFDEPQVSIDIAAYNSKVYYIIQEQFGEGDHVARLPITDNSRIQDAIAHLGGPTRIADARMWVSRPARSGTGSHEMLPVNWQAIADGTDSSTNYQLLPGDRVFVARKSNDDDKPPEKVQTASTDAPNADTSAAIAATETAHEAEVVALQMVHMMYDLKRTIQIVEANHERAIAAKYEVETVRKAYGEKRVTLDLLLDAQRRATDAETAYTKSLVWFRSSESQLQRAENERILAMFELDQAKKGRDEALELWKLVREDGNAEREARAREQYFLYRSRVDVALRDFQNATARLKSLREGKTSSASFFQDG